MTGRGLRLDLVLLVQESEGAGHDLVHVDVSSNATVGELAAFLGSGDEGLELLLWADRAVVPSKALIADAQLFQYARVRVTDGQPLHLAESPELSEKDRFRIVHEDGEQLSIAWPLTDAPLALRREHDGVWLNCTPSEADLVFTLAEDNPQAVRVENVGHRYTTLCNRQEFQQELDVPSGAVIEGTRTDSDDHWQFRVLARHDHDLARNAFGFVPYRVRPRRTSNIEIDTAQIALDSAPTAREPEVDYVEALMNLLPMAAMLAVMSVAIGFRIYFLLTVPALAAAYILIHRRRRSKEIHAWRRPVESKANAR